MPMRWPEPLDEWAQETYQAFQDALPDGRIGYGCHLNKFLRALRNLPHRTATRLSWWGTAAP